MPEIFCNKNWRRVCTRTAMIHVTCTGPSPWPPLLQLPCSFLAVLHIYQEHSYPRAFALTISTPWTLSFEMSRYPAYLEREAFPTPSASLSSWCLFLLYLSSLDVIGTYWLIVCLSLCREAPRRWVGRAYLQCQEQCRAQSRPFTNIC